MSGDLSPAVNARISIGRSRHKGNLEGELVKDPDQPLEGGLEDFAGNGQGRGQPYDRLMGVLRQHPGVRRGRRRPGARPFPA